LCLLDIFKYDYFRFILVLEKLDEQKQDFNLVLQKFEERKQNFNLVLQKFEE